jgi:acyl carrier protein
MSDDERFERLKHIMVNTFGVEEARITRSALLVQDLELDSLDWTELLVTLERETGQEVSESEAREIRTVEDLLGLIGRKQAAASA